MKTAIRTILKSGAVLFGLALCFSCTKEKQAADTLASFSFEQKSMVLLLGQQQELHPVVSPYSFPEGDIVWTSSRPEIVEVSPAGVLTAKALGKSVITATVKAGQTAICEVTVRENFVSVTGVEVTPASSSTYVGDKVLLTAKVLPANATNQAVVWSTSDPAIATVSEKGKVEALAVGTVEITATTVDGEKVGKATITIDAREFKVSFVTYGGTYIADQVVDNGALLARPADPKKDGGLSAGLYSGKVDLDAATYTFAGWFTDEEYTAEYDFNQPVKRDITLYAKWVGDFPEAIKGVEDLAGVVKYVNALTEAGTYTYVLGEDVTSGKLTFKNANANVNIYLVGQGTERTISNVGVSTTPLIEMQAGVNLFVGKNIKLTGKFTGKATSLLYLNGGSATLLAGSKISGVEADGRASAVYLNNGSSTITVDGGEISGNTINAASDSNYSGTICMNWGLVRVVSGSIKNNRVIAGANIAIAGGIFVPHRSQGAPEVTKTGGEISGNTATNSAGKYVGQQVVVGATTQTGDGVYKIDAAVPESVSFTSDGLKKSNFTNKDGIWTLID